MDYAKRNMVFLIGAGIALTGCAGLWRVGKIPKKANNSWDLNDNEKYNDIRLQVLKYAILAPNPHNLQPWLFKFENDSEISFFYDGAKGLPHTDPYDRQITIGCGALLEILTIAALQFGYFAQIDKFPEGFDNSKLDKRPIAKIKLIKKSVEKDYLFSQIQLRHTNRLPYDISKSIKGEDKNALETISYENIKTKIIDDKKLVEALKINCIKSFLIEMKTQNTMLESANLMRIGPKEIAKNPDGIALNNPLFELLSLLGSDEVRKQSKDINSKGFQAQIKKFKNNIENTNAFLIIVSNGESKPYELETGKAYVRAQLEASLRGLKMQPWSHALQEFIEMKEAFEELRQLLGLKPNERLQMFARLGYCKNVEPAPRWPLEHHLI